jgi:hypothetical protein
MRRPAHFAARGKAIDVVGVGGQFWIFALGSDSQMIYKYWDGSAWQPSQTDWEPLGGNFVSPPSAAARNFTYTPAESQLDVVGVSNKGVLYHKYWDGSEWQPSQIGWDDLGPLPVPFAHPPAISGLEGPHLVDIVAVGNDGQAYHKYLDGGTWRPSGMWEALGGLIGRPAVAGLDIAAFNMGFNIFGINSGGGRMEHKYWDGAVWQPSQTGWEDLGGNFVNVASRGMSSNVQFDVFGIGNPSGLFHKWFDSNGWQPSPTEWESLGIDFDYLAGNPAVVQLGDPFNRVDVFVGGLRSVVHNFRGYFGGSWLPNWEVLAGNNDYFGCAPEADGVYPAPSTAILHVACIGELNGPSGYTMLHKTFDSNGWHPSPTDWENVGNGLGNQGIMSFPPLTY